MESKAFIMGLLGMGFSDLLWLVSTTIPEQVALVLFLVGLALDLLGIILGRGIAGRSNAAIGGIIGGLLGLMFLGLVAFMFVAEIASSLPR